MMNEKTRNSVSDIVGEIERAVESSETGGKAVFAYVSGSHLYGTANENSDIDVRMAHLFSPEFLLNVIPKFSPLNYTSQIRLEDNDASSMELGKVCFLMLGCNPAVIEMLYIPKWAVFRSSSYFDGLVDMRDTIMNQQVFRTYSAYASSNLNQLTNHIVRAISDDDPSLGKNVCASFKEWKRSSDGWRKAHLLKDFSVDWSIAAHTKVHKLAMHALRNLFSIGD